MPTCSPSMASQRQSCRGRCRALGSTFTSPPTATDCTTRASSASPQPATRTKARPASCRLGRGGCSFCLLMATLPCGSIPCRPAKRASRCASLSTCATYQRWPLRPSAGSTFVSTCVVRWSGRRSYGCSTRSFRPTPRSERDWRTIRSGRGGACARLLGKRHQLGWRPHARTLGARTAREQCTRHAPPRDGGLATSPLCCACK
mmetsp:Transcript_2021/g.5683  ORF Transcript_2021/g.5683 Transcript_2021/m.5683 type:complete len:203 (+) Transcript_2021:226-834(+)